MNQPRRRASRLDPQTVADLTSFERALRMEGFLAVAGIDEAGRGCLAGPVVAAAVVLPDGCALPGLTDSKKLTKKQRDIFFDRICATARAHAVGLVDAKEIDATDILRAALKAMRIAVDGLSIRPDCLMIDGPFGIDHPLPQRPIVRGDSLSLSIAAASVIAKVTRDRMMVQFESSYPGFSFSVHKGYGTARHLDELRRFGPTPLHRRSFRGVVQDAHEST